MPPLRRRRRKLHWHRIEHDSITAVADRPAVAGVASTMSLASSISVHDVQITRTESQMENQTDDQYQGLAGVAKLLGSDRPPVLVCRLRARSWYFPIGPAPSSWHDQHRNTIYRVFGYYYEITAQNVSTVRQLLTDSRSHSRTQQTDSTAQKKLTSRSGKLEKLPG